MEEPLRLKEDIPEYSSDLGTISFPLIATNQLRWNDGVLEQFWESQKRDSSGYKVGGGEWRPVQQATAGSGP